MSLSKDNVIALWENDKKTHELLTKQIKGILELTIRRKGLNVRILERTKSDASLMKKLYDKGFDHYFEITDKSAARVICKFKQDLDVVQGIIKESFHVIKEDNKIHHLDFKEQGYKSIHFDIKLKVDSVEPELYELLKDGVAEIQVRTNCEDTWAEIYHDIGYKASSDLSQDLKREFHCLAGLLEVADNCFSSLNKRIMELNVLNEEFILNYLKIPFIQKIGDYYNRDFSYKNIQILLPLLNLNSTTDFVKDMDFFLDSNADKIDHILMERKNESKEVPYLSQPEIFLIFYLIVNDIYALIEKWNEYFFIEDLNKLCNYWGISLQDYLIE